MKIFKSCTALLLTVALSIMLCACGGQNGEITAVTKNFEKACNKLDFNAMLDCIDPDVADSVKKLTSIVGMFSDKDTDELLDGLGKVLFSELPGNSREFFSSIEIKINDIEKEENSASATVELTYEISGEVSKSEADFKYVRVDGKWYISDLGL